MWEGSPGSCLQQGVENTTTGSCMWDTHCKCIPSVSTRTSATLGQVKTPSKGCSSTTETEQQLQDSPKGLNLLTGRRCLRGSSGAHPSGPPLHRHRTASSSPRLTAPGEGRDGGKAFTCSSGEVLDRALRTLFTEDTTGALLPVLSRKVKLIISTFRSLKNQEQHGNVNTEFILNIKK